MRSLAPQDRDGYAVGVIAAVVYLLGRPPLYERDGYEYHLLGRDLLAGTNPHHLLWNVVQWLLDRASGLLGIHSTILFQLAGIAFGVAATVVLHRLLLALTGERLFAVVAALFTAFAPWTWFMAYQNQPYALVFLLLVIFLGTFVRDGDGVLPRGWRFAVAAASAVGMVMLQQAAVLIVVGAGACFLVLGGWRRLAAWALATGIPTAVLYLFMAALRGVRNAQAFAQWLTSYLRSQHSLEVRFPDVLSRSVMGIVSTFVNQDPFKDAVVDDWSDAAILWFYGAVGMVLVAAAVVAIRRRRGAASGDDTGRQPVIWMSVATMVSWGVFCLLWEPTNYYWFILLAPFFLCVGAMRPSPRASRNVAIVLVLATAWNLYADRQADAEGAKRAPGPQMRAIAAHMGAGDLLWVVDLGWTGYVDYDLLATISSVDRGPRIVAVSDVAGHYRDAAGWEGAVVDSTDVVLRRGGQVFVSGRAFDSTTYARTWESSPFADYTVERPYPVDWDSLRVEVPALLRGRYAVRPAGFFIGPDTIYRLDLLSPRTPFDGREMPNSH